MPGENTAWTQPFGAMSPFFADHRWLFASRTTSGGRRSRRQWPDRLSGKRRYDPENVFT
jgi:hypothetical protein